MADTFVKAKNYVLFTQNIDRALCQEREREREHVHICMHVCVNVICECSVEVSVAVAGLTLISSLIAPLPSF